MAADLLVVLGATSTQGASVIKHVRAQYPQLAIRGVTRNPASPAATVLQKQGIEVVTGSLDDETSLVSAFKGATQIFALTDYWTLWVTSLRAGNPDLWQAASTAEIQQGKNIIAAASQSLDTLRHLIFSSLPSPSTISSGKYTGLHHFEAKAEVEQILKGNDALAEKTTIVWPGYYMENFARWDLNAYVRPRKDPKTGDYVLSTAATPSTPLNLLATAEDFGKFGKPYLPTHPNSVSPIIPLSPSGATAPPVLAASQYLPFSSIAPVLSQQLQLPISYRQSPPGEMSERYGKFGEVFETMYGYFNEFGFCGGVETRGVTELGLEGKLTGFEEFVAGQPWEGFLLKE